LGCACRKLFCHMRRSSRYLRPFLSTWLRDNGVVSYLTRRLEFSYVRRKGLPLVKRSERRVSDQHVSHRRHSQSSGLDASFLQGCWSTEPSHSCDRQHGRCEVIDAVVVAGSDAFLIWRSDEAQRRAENLSRAGLSHACQVRVWLGPCHV